MEQGPRCPGRGLAETGNYDTITRSTDGSRMTDVYISPDIEADGPTMNAGMAQDTQTGWLAYKTRCSDDC